MESIKNPQDFSQNKETSFKNSLPIEITRTFRAPVERVWRAWSQPELIKQWWGPEEFTCPEAKIDFKVGGKYLLAMKSADGDIVWGSGEYKDIIPFQKIVCTDSFSDAYGKIISPQEAGMPGQWEGDTFLITLEFEMGHDDETVLKLKHEGLPSEMHKDCMEGWNSSFNKLRRLVEQN